MVPYFLKIWDYTRSKVFAPGLMDAERKPGFIRDDDDTHIGDPAALADVQVHQKAEAELVKALHPLGVKVVGEEGVVTQLALDEDDFPLLANVDAIDGSAQAWSIPGGWGHVVVLQQYCGVEDDQETFRLQARFIGIADAEGAVVMADDSSDDIDESPLAASSSGFLLDRFDTKPVPKVTAVPFDLQAIKTLETESGSLIGAGGVPLEVSDNAAEFNRLVFDGADQAISLTPDQTVLVGGYKPAWWERFSALCELVRADGKFLKNAHIFNTAGAPVARKAVINQNVVIAQLTWSSLWDGAAAAIIAKAGGHVIPLMAADGTIPPLTPVPVETVWSWYSTFGWTRNKDHRWTPRMVIPPFVAGLDDGKVIELAEFCGQVLDKDKQPTALRFPDTAARKD